MSNVIIQNESEIFQSQQTKYRPARFAIWSLIGLFLLYQFVGGGITLLLIGGQITADNVTLARVATMVSQILFLLIPTILLAKRQHGIISDVFKWRFPTFLELFLAIVGMIVLMQIGEIYLFFQSKIPIPQPFVPIIESMKKAIEEAFKLLIVARSVPEMLFVVLVAALTPAVCEEMMFRGLIQKNFTLAYGHKKGYVLAGTIFGLYHLNPFWVLPLIALGIYFSFLQYRSQTLILPIIVHFINNGAATVGVYFFGSADTTTPTMFMGGENEPSVTLVLGTGVLFVIIFYFVIVQYVAVTEKVHYPQQLNEQIT